MPSVTVVGTPVAQGWLKCIGKRGKVQHALVPGNAAELKPWRTLLDLGGRQLAQRNAFPEGPVEVSLRFVVPRPASVSRAKRVWPWKRGAGGDLDKLVRAVFDAMTTSGLIGDDSQVCSLIATKAYPDTDDLGLVQPGVNISVSALEVTL